MPFGDAGDGEVGLFVLVREGGLVGRRLRNRCHRFRVNVCATAFTAVADKTDAFS